MDYFITGGIAQVSLNLQALNEFIAHHEEKNHLYVLENMFREMLPPYAARKCDLSASLTDTGNISLILEAVNPGDHQLCQDAILSITSSIKNGFIHDMPRKFEMAAFMSIDNWFRDQVVGVQDRILEASDDLRNQARIKLGDTLREADDKIQRLPNSAHKTLPTFTVLLALARWY